MKEQICPQIQRNSPPPKNSSFDEIELIKDRDNDSGFTGGSESIFSDIEEAEEIQETTQVIKLSDLDELNLKSESYLKNDENDLSTKLRKFSAGEKYSALQFAFSDDFKKLSKKEQKDWLHDKFKLEMSVLPDHMIDLIVGAFFEGDCERSPGEKPNWLDLEKFKRGQKFARDHLFGLSYSQLLSLFILFSFEDGLKTLILTGKSSTPYTAFKRYLSTAIRLRNWYAEDPWTKDTAAYNDIQTVRKMHANVRRRLKETENELIDAAAKIENPYCPTREILSKDFQSTCPAPAPGQCPYLLYRNLDLVPLRPKGLNQGEMVTTQFGFVGLMILYPKSFGAHNATEEDLEAFCHTWRGLGYLLGMDDEYNLCRGSLDDVRQRCRDYLELWAKPNFRELTPECEHMMRCMVEGLQYYFPGSTYESSVLYLSELLNLHTPRLYSSLSYGSWIRHNLVKSFFYYTSRVPGLMTLMNKKLNASLDKAVNFSPAKHEELRKKSEETLMKATNKF